MARPESLPFPKTWRRFKGIKPMPDGRVPEFWIQDATDDTAEEIGQYMVDYFLKEEAISVCLGNDKSSEATMKAACAALVRQRLSLAAFSDWPDGKPRIVGCNVLLVQKKGAPLLGMQNAETSRGMRAVCRIYTTVDIFAKYGVDAYTAALGLSVAPAFRGQRLGVELLKARVQLTSCSRSCQLRDVMARPESLPFPNTWRRFKGIKPMPDGRVPEFWIQDATEDMAEDVGQYMVDYFLKEEAISVCLGHDESTEKTMKETCAALVRQRLGLAAFTDWPDGKPHFAGCNALLVQKKGDPLLGIENAETMRGMGAMTRLDAMVDIYAKYGVDSYTAAFGLSVAPAFRGQRVGVELLKARAQLTRAIGLRLTASTFSGAAAQKQAERAGYELVARLPYAEVTESDGSPAYPGISHTHMEWRARYIEEGTKDEDI